MSDSSALPEGYADWLGGLKDQIRTARQRAALAVNSELVRLYWHIGNEILERQTTQGWGAKVIDQIAQDLRAAFPDMSGLSPRNLKYMRAFASLARRSNCAGTACTIALVSPDRPPREALYRR